MIIGFFAETFCSSDIAPTCPQINIIHRNIRLLCQKQQIRRYTTHKIKKKQILVFLDNYIQEEFANYDKHFSRRSTQKKEYADSKF